MDGVVWSMKKNIFFIIGILMILVMHVSVAEIKTFNSSSCLAGSCSNLIFYPTEGLIIGNNINLNITYLFDDATNLTFYDTSNGAGNDGSAVGTPIYAPQV